MTRAIPSFSSSTEGEELAVTLSPTHLGELAEEEGARRSSRKKERIGFVWNEKVAMGVALWLAEWRGGVLFMLMCNKNVF